MTANLSRVRGYTPFSENLAKKQLNHDDFHRTIWCRFTLVGAAVSLPRHDLAQTVKNMTAEECEVFDLLLRGHDPSDRQQLEIFLSRITSPLSEILLGMINKGVIRKVEGKTAAHLAVDPAAAWFLASPEDRGRRGEPKEQ
ncbi:hypothetical protein NUH88_04310 [Nisaea acidiphila]|uniref:Uncharacterized protein n=1 Tax=Nisaea acidiphila TaxID=1862145 RepID=A0A9J7AXE4_9PROT|nr:hypothetical protein [Nisaea acidiphila]UUX50916.1 hypothetical protein NUH88_04310 [Nisaea acidiphila]